MKRSNSEAAVYTGSIEAQENSSAEVDLYDDLTVFERLTPDEQARLSILPKITAKEDPSVEDSGMGLIGSGTIEPEEPENRIGTSGPLETIDGDIEFTGDLSRGTCISCGAESSTDDLFCLACGVFIEDLS
jgi:hypothetical protein